MQLTCHACHNLGQQAALCPVPHLLLAKVLRLSISFVWHHSPAAATIEWSTTVSLAVIWADQVSKLQPSF